VTSILESDSHIQTSEVFIYCLHNYLPYCFYLHLSYNVLVEDPATPRIPQINGTPLDMLVSSLVYGHTYTPYPLFATRIITLAISYDDYLYMWNFVGILSQRKLDSVLIFRM